MCEKCCEKCNQERLLDIMKQKEDTSLYERERIDFIASNIPVLMNLFRTLDERLKKECTTATEACQNMEYTQSIARQIARYIR